MKKLDKITPIEEKFSRWYTDVVTQGNLIEYGPTKGSIIYKPLSFGIWENIQKELNLIFKKLNVENVYLPTLIPKSLIEKEKEHVEGFAPELATITKVGNNSLTEEYVLRPTSEVLFGPLFSKMINSYNDLPIIYNQWANVFRWEKTTKPFLRTREFLWQEGHTVHSTEIEAKEMANNMIKVYEGFCKDFLAIATHVGDKTDAEKFAGAETTHTIEAMMKDGRALQSGTSHYLAQNFSKPFEIKFKNSDNKLTFGYQTSWGVSTRLLGAIIMSHGDNRGVVIPPRIAPIQIDIIELFADKDPMVKEVSKNICEELSNDFRIKLDSSNKGPGFKAGQSEIQGTPIRIEIGPRDLKENLVTIVRRDTLEKIQVDVSKVFETCGPLLDDIHNNLYNASKTRLTDNIVHVDTYDDLKKNIDLNKWVVAPFSGGKDEEDKIKLDCGATTRCIFSDNKESEKKCIISLQKTKRLVIFAKAY